MAEFPMLQWWPQDFWMKTRHLPLEARGAYRELLDYMWMQRACALPDSDVELARILGITLRRWRQIRPRIEPFFIVGDGQWQHERLTVLRNSCIQKRSVNRTNAALGGRAKALKDQESALANATANAKRTLQRNVSEPEPESESKKEPPSEAPKKGLRSPHGSRLPADWSPSEIDVAYARKQGFANGQLERVAENFRDFWIAKPGAAGRKSDWAATWRTWVRREAERQPPNTGDRHGRHEQGGWGDAIRSVLGRGCDEDAAHHAPDAQLERWPDDERGEGVEALRLSQRR